MWSIENVSKLNDKITSFWKADDYFLFYINHYFDPYFNTNNWLLNNVVRNFDFYVSTTSYISSARHDSMNITVFFKWRFLKTIYFTTHDDTFRADWRYSLQGSSPAYNRFFSILSLLESSDHSFQCLPDEIHFRWWSLIDFSWIEVFKRVWGNENFYKDVIRTYKIDGDYAFHSKNIIYAYMTNTKIFLRKDDWFFSNQTISASTEYKEYLIWQSKKYINNLSLPILFINNKDFQLVCFRDFLTKTYDILKDYNLWFEKVLSIRDDTNKINYIFENGILLELDNSNFLKSKWLSIPDELVKRLQEIWWIKLEKQRSGIISFLFLYDYHNGMVMKTNLENVSSPYVFKNTLFITENWRINIYSKTVKWTLELEEENFLLNDNSDLCSSYKETDNYLFCFWKQKFIIFSKETGKALFTIVYENDNNKQLLLSFLKWDIDIKEDQWKNIIVKFWKSINILYFDIKSKTSKNIILWKKTFSFFNKKINKQNELTFLPPNKIGYSFNLGTKDLSENLISTSIWFSYNNFHLLETQENIDISKYKEMCKASITRYIKEDPFFSTDIVIYQIWIQWINNILNLKNYANINVPNLLGEDKLFKTLSSNLFSTSSIGDFQWLDKYLTFLISWKEKTRTNNFYVDTIHWLRCKIKHIPFENNPSYTADFLTLKQNNHKMICLLEKN